MKNIKNFFIVTISILCVTVLVLGVTFYAQYMQQRSDRDNLQTANQEALQEIPGLHVVLDEKTPKMNDITIVNDAYKYKELEKALDIICDYTDEKIESEESEAINEDADGYIPNDP